MKKLKAIFAIMLTLLFSVSAGGVFHYCHGELAGYSLLNAHSDVDCGMDGCELPSDGDFVISSNCCDNYHIQVVVDDYQASSKPEMLLAEHDIFETISIFLTSYFSAQRSPGSHFYSHPPELLHAVNLSVIQVYLI